MNLIADSKVWEASLCFEDGTRGVLPLGVVAKDQDRNTGEDEIQVLIGTELPTRKRTKRDQDNALAAWAEHGMLGTQLGPNKNGRKW